MGADPVTAPERFKVTVPQCDPDLRCDSTAVVGMPHGVDEPYGLDCVLHFEHDGDHTDGDDTWWGDDGEVEFR
jgi:hypothetical protein